jgi:alpha-ribazole phosphatase
MKLILVRHGETVAESGIRYWGATDVELSAYGIEQAKRLAVRLESESVNAVYSSELKRAKLTAETIMGENRLPITHCVELNEVNFGRLEGLTLVEINEQFPDTGREWLKWSSEIAFPGGESVSAFNARVCRFAGRLKVHNEHDTILVVAHAGSLRMLMCHLLELALPHWRQLRLELASLSIIDLTPQGAVLVRLNDISHLG